MSEAAETRQRRLLLGWGVSAVLVLVGVAVVLLTPATVPGFVLFAVGAVGSVLVTVGAVRARFAARR